MKLQPSMLEAQVCILALALLLLALSILYLYIANRYCETLSRIGVPSNRENNAAHQNYVWAKACVEGSALGLLLAVVFATTF